MVSLPEYDIEVSDDEAPPSEQVSGEPGQVLAGTFRLDSVIGSGAMGTVWRATHLASERVVAVKMIARHCLADVELRRRFGREIKVLTRLRSPFAIETYAFGETRTGLPYIVMEYLEGESIEARLRRVGPCSLPLTVRIAVQTARGLSHAHRLGIVHRDLKPANVFLTGQDRSLRAKVLDFGIAKVRTEVGEGTTVTETGFVVGTPEYMSPEQCRGAKTLDHRSDLYALGTLVYAMLVGSPPFQLESPADTLLAIVTQPLPSLRAAVAGLPEAMEQWFQYACAYEPDARYQRAQELAQGLFLASGLPGTLQDCLD